MIVKRRKLQWYGQVSRSSSLAKTILQGTVKGGRRQGGQRKRWEDNIRELTGLEFGKSQRAVENRGKWRKLVAKSSMLPQRLSRLRLVSYLVGLMMMMMMMMSWDAEGGGPREHQAGMSFTVLLKSCLIE